MPAATGPAVSTPAPTVRLADPVPQHRAAGLDHGEQHQRRGGVQPNCDRVGPASDRMAVTMSTESTRTTCRSHPTGVPIHVSTRSSITPNRTAVMPIMFSAPGLRPNGGVLALGPD